MDKLTQTLNLPKTNFKMKANLPLKEPEILKFWEQNKIYDKIMSKNEKKPCYILHDGPPYANGNIHLGHALNKILKDIVVKFKNMSGYYTPFIPGWDTHGLPTELKTLSKHNSTNFSDVIDFRLKCKETATEYINIQRQEFIRLGVFGDWFDPYITFDPNFEAAQIEIFAQMVKKGAIYKGLKPVYWCTSCKTALAEAELEYKEDDCESVFVKFKLEQNIDKNNLFIQKIIELGIDLNKVFVVIWTTTSWTLPANVAICVNASYDYALVEFDGEFLLISNNLIDKCFQNIDANNQIYRVVFSIKGECLEKIMWENPVLNRKSLTILGEHVTLTAGTGCVHTAPGHGLEDFEICKKYGLEVFVPINSLGVYIKAGKYNGLSIFKSHSKIKEDLIQNNRLFASKKIMHKYPHCWRCKEPVIFRATEQWFCSIEKFKEDALKAIKSVKWMPSWGIDRISSMIQERSDWCISRQRRWGVPIPVFNCKNCNEPLLNYDIIMNISKKIALHGSDLWYIKDESYFLDEFKNKINCKKCESGEFVKELDIMDVWFDSGTTYKSVLKGEHFPASLYLEGSDQHRGWFQSSLLTSVCSCNKAPYKSVLTHGWVVDEEGKKQSKSLGNVISPQVIIEKYGADILRLWVSSVDYTFDVKISEGILGQIVEFYRKFRNTARYILGNIYDFDPESDFVNWNNLLSMDKWILYKLNILNKSCLELYEKFEFYTIFRLIQKFCIIELSNFYLDVIKDKLYVQLKSSIQRRSVQTAIYTILKTLTKLVSPILSFTAEEIWGNLPKKETESVFLSSFSNIDELEDMNELNIKWEKIKSIVGDVKKILENFRKDKVIGSSLEACVIFFTESDEDYNFINENLLEIKESLIVSFVKIIKEKGQHSLDNHKNIFVRVEKSTEKKCMRCWCLNNSVKKNDEYGDICKRCEKILLNLN